MWLHAVDLDGFDKIPNVLQLNRNIKPVFYSVFNSETKEFWSFLVLVCLGVTSGKSCFNSDFRNQPEPLFSLLYWVSHTWLDKTASAVSLPREILMENLLQTGKSDTLSDFSNW